MTEGNDSSRSWSVVRLDPEAGRWRDIARDGFWLRYPAALEAPTPWRPLGLGPAADVFPRYGAELNVLEHDLAECLNEFKQAYQMLYREPQAIAQKKFSIVYHVDNFAVRVQKLRENVYRLFALVGGLDPL